MPVPPTGMDLCISESRIELRERRERERERERERGVRSEEVQVVRVRLTGIEGGLLRTTRWSSLCMMVRG